MARLGKPIITSSKAVPSSVASQAARVKERIPLDPAEFYHDFGLIEHPRIRGKAVKDFAPYQYEVWKACQQHNYVMVVKSQKIGMTTSTLLMDFQMALTYARGREILIIAQDAPHAFNHLRDLRNAIMLSKKYSKYLIRNNEDSLFRDDKTKAGVIHIRNPDDPHKHTRIIARGSNEAGVWSWKNVALIHMSDVAATNQVDDSGLFNAAFSRLANTMGKMIIESPPRGQRGTFYEIYRKSKLDRNDIDQGDPLGQFKIFEIPAREGVAAGIMTQSFLDNEKVRLGRAYGQYYECEFLSASNQWYDPSLFGSADYTPEY
jgi:hypothetical protein